MKFSLSINISTDGKFVQAITGKIKDIKTRIETRWEEHRTRDDYMKWCEEQYRENNVTKVEPKISIVEEISC